MTPLVSWALIGLIAVGAWHGAKLCAAITNLVSLKEERRQEHAMDS